jgi:hypothetical protein
MILNRQDAKAAKKSIFRDKKLGVLGVLAVKFLFVRHFKFHHETKA